MTRNFVSEGIEEGRDGYIGGRERDGVKLPYKRFALSEFFVSEVECMQCWLGSPTTHPTVRWTNNYLQMMSPRDHLNTVEIVRTRFEEQ